MANTPPNILTAKDRLYLEDVLNYTMVYYKKSQHYSSLVSDKETQRRLVEFSKTLAHHYDEVLAIMENKVSKGVKYE